MPATQGRVLIAVSPQTRARLDKILSGYDTTYAETFRAVQAVFAKGRFDLAVVGCRFDESSTFDAVQYVRQRDPEVRIACVRGPEHRYSDEELAFHMLASMPSPAPR